MKNRKYKSKRFLLPILSLVIVSIVLIASISSYITIKMFKSHMEEQIEKAKISYTKDQKNRVHKEVDFVKESIEFQISEAENILKASLKDKINIALNVANSIYNTYKDTNSKEEIKEKIAKTLSLIKFDDGLSYYFMYDNKTKVMFGHPLSEFVGKDMTNFKDHNGQNIVEQFSAELEKNNIAYNKIYFAKPNDKGKDFPKITCIAKFETLGLVFGIGEYLDVIEEQSKKYVLNRFSKTKDYEKDKYIAILDVHNLEGGDDFATVLLNSNKPELVGKKTSDKDLDIKGNMYKKDYLTLIKEKGEGFTEYWYKKPSTNLPELKISYIYFQKDWSWIILSGFYYDDLENKISTMKELISSYTNNIIKETLFWVALLSFFAILVAIFVSLKIDKTIKEYTNAIIVYEDNKRKQEHMLTQQSKIVAMGEMILNIAHQWRQPLSTISIVATGTKLQKEMNCLSNEQLNTALTTINDSSQYLSKIIDDFAEFFNSSNNRMNEYNINDVLDKTVEIINAQLINKNIELVKDIEKFKILSIENELIQVLVNILNNAADALALNKNERKLIFIETYQKNNYSYIKIKDNAGGVPEDIIDRIFEPYFTTKHQSQGTGIGLYMSEEIVRNHLNGKLSVSNKEYMFDGFSYMGACFTIEITEILGN
jgi:two-component system, NtrC family, sensor kinase